MEEIKNYLIVGINITTDEKFLNNYLKGSKIQDLIHWGFANKSYMKKSDFSDADLKYYQPQSYCQRRWYRKLYYYSYFKKWTPQENYYYAVENTGFEGKIDRSEGTYSKYASLDDKFDGFHYYMRYIKFGLGRCIDDAAHEIRDGHITRDEAIKLVQKYDGEFPKKYYRDFLDYLEINENQFNEIVESWRSSKIWKKSGNNWVLKYPLK